MDHLLLLLQYIQSGEEENKFYFETVIFNSLFLSISFSLKIMNYKFYLSIIFLFAVPYSLFSENIINKEKNDPKYYINHLEALAKGSNKTRYNYILSLFEDAEKHKLSIKTESVDWLGLYKNIIIEKKGISDSIIYIVCHYDKIDNNIFTTLNTYVNGGFDFLLSNLYLSNGVYDNGTGVVICLSLIDYIVEQTPKYTYRFLFTAMEEYGLRGVRRHVSAISKEEWAKVYFAINIDMVGANDIYGISITQNISDTLLINISDSICKKHNYILNQNVLPKGALSDFYFFQGQSFFKDFSTSLIINIPGAFIPQRSYFTSKKEKKPIVNFTDRFYFRFYEYISPISPVGFGRIHSYRDNITKVNIENLSNYTQFFISFLNYVEYNL
jgi:hypothetical protein